MAVDSREGDHSKRIRSSPVEEWERGTTKDLIPGHAIGFNPKREEPQHRILYPQTQGA
jgi:hypothetical protein